MHAIGLPSEIFLAFMLGVLPWAAYRSAKVFNAPPAADGAKPARPIPSVATIQANTAVLMVVLFVLSWFTAKSFGYGVFTVPELGMKEIFAGLGALAFQYAMMFANRAMRTADEIRNMPVGRLMPRTGRERVLWIIISVLAGIAEEAAYRGVLMAVLWYALGNPWLAAAISATAFAIGHALQGWKSVLVIFVMALSMHVLVWFTGTLVIAMAVHAIYDLLAPTVRRKLLPEPPTDPERSAG